MLAAALLAGALASAAAAASMPLPDVVTEAAFGFCPRFLEGKAVLVSADRAERGFAAEVMHKSHPRLGELSYVTAERPDGVIHLGGVPGRICQVIVQTQTPDAVAARLHAALPGPMNFKPDASADLKGPTINVETYGASFAGGQATLQLIQASGPKPTIIAQILQSGS